VLACWTPPGRGKKGLVGGGRERKGGKRVSYISVLEGVLPSFGDNLLNRFCIPIGRSARALLGNKRHNLIKEKPFRELFL
jgi:hypothetical protein